MGPYVRAVTLVEQCERGCWEHEYARARGWDEAGRAVYLEARAEANGPGWWESVQVGRWAEVRETFGVPVVRQVREGWE